MAANQHFARGGYGRSDYGSASNIHTSGPSSAYTRSGVSGMRSRSDKVGTYEVGYDDGAGGEEYVYKGDFNDDYDDETGELRRGGKGGEARAGVIVAAVLGALLVLGGGGWLVWKLCCKSSDDGKSEGESEQGQGQGGG